MGTQMSWDKRINQYKKKTRSRGHSMVIFRLKTLQDKHFTFAFNTLALLCFLRRRVKIWVIKIGRCIHQLIVVSVSRTVGTNIFFHLLTQELVPFVTSLASLALHSFSLCLVSHRFSVLIFFRFLLWLFRFSEFFITKFLLRCRQRSG